MDIRFRNRLAFLTGGWLLSILALLLFLSGISALIYQILWLRLLALVFGVTVHAASTVLASFMAGLALGSFAAGRLADRVRRPLVWFAAAEAGVALSALATRPALAGVEQVFRSLVPHLPQEPGLLTLVRFVCSFGILIVPTMLMGATLPLVVRASLTRLEGLGERVSVLYASNTAGAIAGTLLAGFYLIGRIGITLSFQVAATLNLLVSVSAAVTSLAMPERQPGVGGVGARPDDTEPDALVGIPAADRARRLVLIVFALSGFASLALEVIWFRVLVLFVPATIYAFATMLGTFLTGIAAGSYVVTPLMRRRVNWLATLAAIELAIGIVSLLSLTALATTYQAGWRTSGTLQASVVALLPSTLLMGIAFPIGLRIYGSGGPDAARRVGERIGFLYSLNVCGAILGALAAGFLLLPKLGSQRSFVIVGLVSVASGVLLLTALPRAQARLAAGTGFGGLVLFGVAALNLADPFAAVQARRYPGERLFWREEGVQTTVSVHVRPIGGRVLYLDGLHQANDSPEMIRVHAQIGHLPMALHPNPRAALVVGLGGGVTAGAVSRHAGVSVDVVELSEAVVRGSDWFRNVNDDVLRQPNVRLRIDDGRNYLMLTSKRYDVVTADLIQPFHAGAGNLYSVEYFRLARRVLADDGLMLQWIGRRPETQYKLIMRTFLRVFPHTTLWVDGSLMVGTKQPLRLDPADFERKLQHPATRAALESMAWTRFEALGALYSAGPEELRRFVGPGAILTDDRPMVEYHRSLPPNDPDVDLSSLRGDVWRHVTR